MTPQDESLATKPPVKWGSLRSKLLITLAASLAPVILLGIISTALDAHKGLETRRQDLQLIADDSVGNVERSLAQAELLLDLYKVELSAGRCGSVWSALSPVVPSLNNAVYFNADGIALCSATSEAGYTVSNPDWILKLERGEYTLMTDSVFGSASKQWLFGIFSRIEDKSGVFKGAAAFSLKTDALVALAHGETLPEDAEIALSDTTGRVHGSQRFDTLPPDWVDQMKREEGAHFFTFKDQNDQMLDVVLQPVGSSNVYALISRTTPGAFSDLAISPMKSIALPLLAFMAALISVWLAVDSLILRWMNRLQRMVKVFAAGAYHYQSGNSFKQAPDEFAELAGAMDLMATEISQRDKALREALAMRDAAVKEIHHRVKNNLQIVTSFLSLQSRQPAAAGAREALSVAQHRINALAIVHQTLYQHERLDTVHLKPFLSSLMDHLAEALGISEMGITLHQSYIECDRASDDAIPIALFMVEAVTNAAKYAFNEKGGTLSVSLSEGEDVIILEIADDGPGHSPAEGAAEGLGTRLMSAFARQLKAKLEVDDRGGEGYRVSLIMPGYC